MKRSVVLAAVLAACIDPGSSTLIAPTDSRSALVFFERNGAIHAQAISTSEPSGALDPLPPDESLAITVLFFREGLDALSLAPGDVPLSEEGRPIPRVSRGIFRAEGAHRGLGPWEELLVLPEEIAATRLPPIDYFACASSSGCLDPELEGFCRLPCGEPALPSLPLAPDAVAPPVFGACPPGWTRPDASCRPASEDAPLPCTSPEAPFADGCRALGDCGGDWPASLPVGLPIRWVRPGGPRGDGTMDRPHATIAEALANPPPELVVAIGRGVAEETVTLPDGILLIGICPSASLIRAPQGASEAIVTRGRATLRDLAIEGRLRAIGGALDLLRVEARASSSEAIVLDDRGTITGRELALSGGAPSVLAIRSGQANLSSISVVRTSSSIGIEIGAGSSAVLQDLAVRGHGAMGGSGIVVRGGSRLELDRALVSGGSESGLFVTEGSTLSAGFLVVAAIEGPGIRVEGGSLAQLSKLRVSETRKRGIDVSRSALEIEDGAVQDSRAQTTEGDDTGGSAIVIDAGRGFVDRVIIERAAKYGLLVKSRSIVEVNDLALASIPANVESRVGAGMQIESGGFVTFRRVEARECPESAILLRDGGGARGSDLTIFRGDTGVLIDPPAGFVLDKAAITNLEFDAIRMAKTRFLAPGTGTATITDLAIHDTRNGIVLLNSERLNLQRAKIDGIAISGMRVGNEVIAELREIQLGAREDRGEGEALSVQDQGRARLTRFEIQGFKTGATIQQGSLDLSVGKIGAHVKIFECPPGYDLSRLMDRVSIDLTNGGLGCEDASR
jgi:hypothetical protein